MLNFKNAKDLQNAIGFENHYGLSPALLTLPKTKKENLKICYLATKDLRHFFKSIGDLNRYANTLQFSWVENDINNLLRNFLLFKVLQSEDLTN